MELSLRSLGIKPKAVVISDYELLSNYNTLSMEGMDLVRELERLDRVKKVASTIKDFGITPSLESLFGEELKALGLSKFDNKKDAAKVYASFESDSRTIWQRIWAWVQKFADWVKSIVTGIDAKVSEADTIIKDMKENDKKFVLDDTKKAVFIKRADYDDNTAIISECYHKFETDKKRLMDTSSYRPSEGLGGFDKDLETVKKVLATEEERVVTERFNGIGAIIADLTVNNSNFIATSKAAKDVIASATSLVARNKDKQKITFGEKDEVDGQLYIDGLSHLIKEAHQLISMETLQHRHTIDEANRVFKCMKAK